MEWVAALSLSARIVAGILAVLGTILLLCFLALHRHAQVQRRRVEALRERARGAPPVVPMAKPREHTLY